MNLTISKSILLKALQRVAGTAKRNRTMPILSCVLLVADENKISLTAFDLEIGIRVSCLDSVQVESAGKVAVPFTKILDLVKVLPEEEVSLDLLDNFRLQVTSGESISRIGCFDPAEFPSIGSDSRKKWKSFSLYSDDLQALLGSCLHSMSSDEEKYNLCGVYLTLENGLLVAVSTDGHRLSLAGREFEDMPGPGTGVIIPAKGVEEIMRLPSDHMGLHLGPNVLEVVQGDLFLSIRLVEGEFPGFRKAIPADLPHYCSFGRADLVDAIGRVRLLSLKNTISILIETNALILKASNDSDEGIDSIVSKTAGANTAFKINGKYLLDALSSFEGSEVILKYHDGLSSIVLLPANFDKWDERLAVIQPMRF